jgi:nitroreductase
MVSEGSAAVGADAQSDIWTVMRTNRAFRRFTTEPVDDSVLATCLEAATWAPSGGNQQPWRFVVLSSPASRQALAAGAAKALEVIATSYGLDAPPAEATTPRERMARDLFNLHNNAARVPAAVLFCSRPLPLTPPLLQGANIFPAMQNFLLAARAQGLGTLVTGWHIGAESALRDTVGIPDEWELAALVVAGWPEANFSPVRRKPVASVAFLDTWDHPLIG